jgi:hypothetical protein
MSETYTIDDLRPLVGHEIVGSDGEFAGYVDVVFLDDASGRPEWFGVWGGFPGESRVLAPVQGLELEGDQVRLPWAKDVIAAAPRYDDEDQTGVFFREGRLHVSAEREREAFDHYGLTPPGAAATAPRLLAWEVTERAQRAER